MRIIKSILKLANFIVIACIVMLALYFISSKISGISGYQSFVVKSGSMEPSIMTGDIIISKLKTPETVYNVNDVITYNVTDKGEDKIVTHRIVKIISDGNNPNYQTKGDANRTEDNGNILRSQIIGKTVYTIPKMGYIVSYTKTLPGLIMLLLLPASLYIIDELIRLRNAKR